MRHFTPSQKQMNTHIKHGIRIGLIQLGIGAIIRALDRELDSKLRLAHSTCFDAVPMRAMVRLPVDDFVVSTSQLGRTPADEAAWESQTTQFTVLWGALTTTWTSSTIASMRGF